MIEGLLFFSESIGYAKPSRGFFDACIKAACGLLTCWYNPRQLCGSADYVVQTPEEIKNIL